MLEILIPGIRQGNGVIGASTAYRGSFCFISGFNSSSEAILRLPYTSANAWGAVYPINKIYYPADYGDTSDAIDKLTAGDGVVYYEGGEYETTEWYPSSFGITSTYWNSVEGAVSSSYGNRMYKPGFDTVMATLGALKAWPCVSLEVIGTNNVQGTLGARIGMLVGDASAAGYSKTSESARDGFVAQIIGIHGSSSADARLRYRIPMNKPGRAAYGGTDKPAI